MQEEKDALSNGYRIDAETGEVFPMTDEVGETSPLEEAEEALPTASGAGGEEAFHAPDGGEPGRSAPKGKKRRGNKKLIAMICAAVAVLAAAATLLGVFLRGKTVDEPPVLYSLEFLGLDREVTVTGEAGAAYTAPDTAREGYQFEGWYSDAEYANRVELPAVMPAENMQFFARYSQLYTVCFWDESELLADFTGKAGTAISVPETQKAGFVCEGWFSDLEGTQPAQAPTSIPEGGGNYYVKYAELFTVTFWDGETELARFTGKRGTKIEAPDAQKQGYDFEGWSNGTEITVPHATIEGNARFFAQFAKLYTVVFWDEGTELYRLTGKAGVAVQIPQPQKDGFVFHGWRAESGEEVTPSAVLQADANYYTLFARLYSVEFKAEGECVQSLQKEAGEEIAAPAAPDKTGHTFVGWFEEKDAGQEVLSFPQTVARDVVFVALYGENPFLTFYANVPLGAQASGEMKAREGEYGKENIVAADNAFAVEGYEFAGWAESADGFVAYGNGADIAFSAHKTLFAQWARAYKSAGDGGIIFYTPLAEGYPAYVVGEKRITGDLAINALGDTEYFFLTGSGELCGRLNLDGSYESKSEESGWYALADGKAYLGGYGEAGMWCGGQSERGTYRIEMQTLLYYAGEARTGIYRFDRAAGEMVFVDNCAAYGNYYGEHMSALVLGAQAEFNGEKGVYVAAGEAVYFYFNGVETQGRLANNRLEYGGNTYERIDGELTLYGEAGEMLKFIPDGSKSERAAEWCAGGETLEGTLIVGDVPVFRGGNEGYVYEWELEISLSGRSVRIAKRQERIRYVNAEELLQFEAGERDGYAVLWRITNGEKDVIEGSAFTTAEGDPFFVALQPRSAAKEYKGTLGGIGYTYKCTFGSGEFHCDWYGLRRSTLYSGAFCYETVEYAGGRGYEAYEGYAVRERIEARLTENGEGISPRFLFLRGQTEVSLITEGAHAGRYELTFTRNTNGYLSGMSAVKYRNLSAGGGLLAMDGEREVSFLFSEPDWRECEITRREEHGYPLLLADGHIFLREGEELNECTYRLFDKIKTLTAGGRVLYAEVETESGVQDAKEHDGAWLVEEELYTLRITFTGSGAEMRAVTERIDRLFCAAGERLRERTEVYYTMREPDVLGQLVRVTSGGRDQCILDTFDTERGLCIRVSDENGEAADWLFTAGEPEIIYAARQEETLGDVVRFTVLYTDDWYTMLPRASFYFNGGKSCEGTLSHTGNEWVWQSAEAAFEGLEIKMSVARGAIEVDPFTLQAEGVPEIIAQGDAQAIVYKSGGSLRLGGFTVEGVACDEHTEPLKNVFYFPEEGYLLLAEEERIATVTELTATDGRFVFTYAQISDLEVVPLGLSKEGSALFGQFTMGDAFVFRGEKAYSVVLFDGMLQVFEGAPKLYVLLFKNGAEEKTVYAPAGAFELPVLPLTNGYKHVGWKISGKDIYTGSYTVDGNASFTAEWAPCRTVNIYLSPEDAYEGRIYAALEVKKKDDTDWIYLEEDLSALGLLPQKEGFVAEWYTFYAVDYDPETGEGGCDFPFNGDWDNEADGIVLIWKEAKQQ